MVTFAGRWRLSDQRIRTKLTLILVLPLLAIVALAGLNVVSATAASNSAEQARQLVVLGTRAAELAERLQSERAAAALVFAAGPEAAPVDEYRQLTAATDAAVLRFREQRRNAAPPEMFRTTLSRIDGEFDDLRSVRQQVLSAPDALASVVTFRYRVIIADLLRLRDSLPRVDAATEIAERLQATAALGTAAEALGVVQTTVVRSLAAGRITPATQGEILAADTSFTEALAKFRNLAPAAWTSRYNRVVAGPEVLTAERLHSVVTRAQPGPLPALGTDAKGWISAVRARIRLLHALESELDAQLVTEIERQRDEAQRTIGLMSGGVGLAILAMIGLGAIVARSLTQSLTGLRATAETIAHTRLPEMVAEVSAGSVDLDRTRRMVAEIAEPIPIRGQDEVGQVAAAFNAVTASAVRLAGEQAALRGGVRAIFNSLSRRSQRRLNTVMTSIDSLQAKETDPDQLSLLFQLDHAATGLRRLTAGLQVLAGGRAGLARPHPMVLADVLRAAQSEIDQYQRVDIGAVDDDVLLHGESVEEVIHLLAELLDNAARFSPPNSLVLVDGRRVGDRLHIQLTDQGKGMTEAQLAAARSRIANPHRLDHHAAQQMGLPVVAAIADRLGISVELRAAKPQGTRVDLTLPPALFRTVSPSARAGQPNELPTAERGHPALSPAAPAPAGLPASPLSPALPAAEASPLELSLTPQEVPSIAAAGTAAAKPATGDGETSGNGETTLELLELGSGWPSALPWSSQAAPAQATPAQATGPWSVEPQVAQVVQPPAEPPAPESPVQPPRSPEVAGDLPAHLVPAPEIFQRLKHAWFGGNPAAPDLDGSEPEAIAEAPVELTGSGLPKRRRGAGRTPARDDGAGPRGGSIPPRGQWPPSGQPAAAQPTPEPLPTRRPPGDPAGTLAVPAASAAPGTPASAAASAAPGTPASAVSPAALAAPSDQRRNRDSDQLRRRYAGLERGLMAARRRSAPSLPQEEEQS